MTQSLPLAVCVCDSRWNILHANAEAIRLLSVYGANEPCGASVLHFLPPSSREAAEAVLGERVRKAEAAGEDTWQLHLERQPLESSVRLELTATRLPWDDAGPGADAIWQIALRCLPEHDASHFPRAGGFLDANHDALFTWWLPDGNIEYWSAAAEHLYGYTAEEARGKNAAQLLGTQLGAGAALPETALRATRKWSGEVVRRNKQSEEVIVEARMKLLDESAIVVESSRDITPRRRAEQAFNFHFQLTQSITEQAVDPIFVIGGRGEIIFTNPEAERVFGWKREDLLGRSLHSTLHHGHADGSTYPTEDCPLFQAQANGTVVRGLELIFFHRDGHSIYVSCSNSPLFFDNQEIGAVLIIRDISAQKVMERALSQSEERLRVAVAAAQMGTWDLNLLSSNVSLDENCRKALNLDSDGHNFVTSWLRAVHPEDRILAKQRIESALDPTGDGDFLLECRTVGRVGSRAGGETRYVQAQGQAFFETNGETKRAVRLIGTIQDITDRKRDEDALRRANDDLQQFAYAAAHDLQEPLRNVVNLLGLYKRNSGAEISPENTDLIDASMEDARRMHQMVRDLLSFTNIHQSPGPSSTFADANSILKDVNRNLSTIITESGAVIVSDDLPNVRMRPTHLLQLLQNLISNSVKYRRVDVPLQIRVTVRRKGADWLFAVADNGIGFDPAYAQRIFGVFKRLHGRAEYPGSGIGLAICARIVHTYSGSIWGEGRPGQGATFYFCLPPAVIGL